MTSAIGRQQTQHSENSFAMGLASVVATQIITTCVEFPRGSSGTPLGQASGPCVCSGVSLCLELHSCVYLQVEWRGLLCQMALPGYTFP